MVTRATTPLTCLILINMLIYDKEHYILKDINILPLKSHGLSATVYQVSAITLASRTTTHITNYVTK